MFSKKVKFDLLTLETVNSITLVKLANIKKSNYIMNNRYIVSNNIIAQTAAEYFLQ